MSDRRLLHADNPDGPLTNAATVASRPLGVDRPPGATAVSVRRQIVVVLLALAVGVTIIALTAWPAPTTTPRRDVTSAAAPSGLQPGETVNAADLAECPRPTDGAAPVPALAGIQAACLGSPRRVDVGAALAGRAVLVNVWASWCAPCREEIPVLDRYARSPGAIPVIGLNVQDKPASAAALLTDLGVGYPSFESADAIARALAAPPLLPLSYVIGADGTARRVTTVAVFRDERQVRDAVAASS